MTTTAQAEADVFVQLAAQGHPTRAMWTTLRYTDDRRLVLTLADTAEEVVLIDRGRYEMPLIEARVGRYTEVTLLRPDGSRIMLQLEERKRPRHPMGDEAVAAC
ncbi:MAG: hypothetical protein QOJ12_2750 [Thermoleophilales bacterium]|nr:hypothetical protein [Thermoleophilales bacterium]